MIRGRQFVIGHLGRTGGDAVLAWMLAHFPHLVRRYDPPDDPAKHAPFPPGADLRALGIRRLPAWILSHREESKQPEGHPVDPSPDAADKELRRLTGGDLTGIVWLRQEYLADDFLRFLGRFDPTAQDKRPVLLATPTKPPLPYDHDWTKHFTPAETATLYGANPLWRSAELAAYRWLLQ